jgi:L-serine dehydratase
MESIQELFRIGCGPSSSHTMAPRRAAELFRQRNPEANRFRVSLYGSLVATGSGHLTDAAIKIALAPMPVEVVWRPDKTLPFHPKGMAFEVLGAQGQLLSTWEVYSTGGGALRQPEDPHEHPQVYPLTSVRAILKHCTQTGKSFREYVEDSEGPEIWNFLRLVRRIMAEAIERGLIAEGVLPGGLGVARKASTIHRKIFLSGANFLQNGYLPAYALAVAEENATGGIIVTAPTCGSCGVLPAVLRYFEENMA